MTIRFFFAVFLLSGVFCGSLQVRAVDIAPAASPTTTVPAPATGVLLPDIALTGAPPTPGALPPPPAENIFTRSLFFSAQEEEAIRQALMGVMDMAPLGPSVPGPGAPPPVYSVIKLYGVLYRGPDDWIVWINGHKVTPEELLPEIRDIKVDKSSKVHLKWYDAAFGGVIAITLRPHQMYDVQTGILLSTSQ